MAWGFNINTGAGNYSMRGFDANNSGNAKTAIQDFIDAINAEISKMQSTTQEMIDNALKGMGQQKEVQGYVERTIEELKKVSSYFEAFKTGIETVQSNYEAKQQGINVGEVTDAKTASGYSSDEEVSGVKPFSD